MYNVRLFGIITMNPPCTINISKKKKKETLERAWHQWLMPVILDTQEAEIRKITVRSQPGQIVCEIQHQKRAGGEAQVVEHLPNKHEAQSSKPEPHKKNWDALK
jgi:hypothetical protein